MTKVKKEKRREAEEEAETETGVEVPERSYEEMLTNLNPIAQPMAGRKLTKRLYKCIKKAVKHKNIRRGVKEVQKFINKGEKGIVVLAGDTLPIEVYCHVPVMCEDRGIPYAYIPSKSGSRKHDRSPSPDPPSLEQEWVEDGEELKAQDSVEGPADESASEQSGQEDIQLMFASVAEASDPDSDRNGAAAGSKRPTCVIMVKPNSEYEDSYNDCMEDVQALPLPY
ncbi:hypothetical protein AB205_0105770 [Aquarana catesbeiana]|uniref:Ribosomal protein eL8/eL30/eS12/Gadd45 domain-containing protein n=1 Tax=Aquarana catesbeiana TaxID=8400 RepID=A0A2G9SFW4_AQUCT|nr:hypothetical protein AB205_0105770 [Aquarana catesbeiana]